MCASRALGPSGAASVPAHLQPPWGPECSLLTLQGAVREFSHGGFTGAWQSQRLFLFTEQRSLPTLRTRMEAEF